MDSLQIRFSELGLEERARNLKSLHKSIVLNPFSKKNSSSSSSSHFLKISCGLRGGPRKPLWRGRVLSTEAIQAVQSLKLAKSASKLEDVFDSKISRLLKADLIATLEELQRQNEWEIALKVLFSFFRFLGCFPFRGVDGFCKRFLQVVGFGCVWMYPESLLAPQCVWIPYFDWWDVFLNAFFAEN